MGEKSMEYSRRRIGTIIGSGIGLTSFSGLAGASGNDSEPNFDPHDFKQVFRYLIEYRNAERKERKEMEKNLGSKEKSSLVDVVTPTGMALYWPFDAVQQGTSEEIPSGASVVKTEDGRILIKTEKNIRAKPQERWNWDEEVMKSLIKNDDVEKLPLSMRSEKVKSKRHEKTETNSLLNQYNTLSRSDVELLSTSDDYSFTMEKQNIGGISTAWIWEHEIDWDWSSGQISGYRNFSRPQHTTWFLTYDGELDEEEWIKNNNGDEEYNSYLQVKFTQNEPITGLTNYDAYPSSTLVGSSEDGSGYEESHYFND